MGKACDNCEETLLWWVITVCWCGKGIPHLGWTQYVLVSAWEWITLISFLWRIQKEEDKAVGWHCAFGEEGSTEM